MKDNNNTLRIYPVIEKWSATVRFTVPDEIPPDVFENMVRLAGARIGLGWWRPEKGGIKGQFRATKFIWS